MSSIPHLEEKQVTTPALKFTHLTLEDGLPHPRVRGVLQDRQGFMWFGTDGGVARYDGYECKIYRYDHHDDRSLSFNIIWVMLEDRAGTLWMGTNGGGVSRYNRETDDFTRFLHVPADSTSLPDNVVRELYEDQAGTLWVGTLEGGLSRFDPANGTFRTFRHNLADPSNLIDNGVHAICEDPESGLLWLGTPRNGIVLFDRTTEQFTPCQPQFDNLCNEHVNHICRDRDGHMWIATHSGLYRFNPQSETMTGYWHDPRNPTSLAHNFLSKIYADRAGRLWFATGNGLDLYDRQTDAFIHHQDKLNNPNGFWGVEVYIIYEDRTGALWIGSANGINRIAGEPEKFTVYRHNPRNPNSLSHNQVMSIFVDRADMIWIGTRNGLNRFDGETFTRYLPNSDDPNSLSNGVVDAIVEDSRGNLWMSTNHGLNRFDGETFTRYLPNPDDPDSLAGPWLTDLILDQSGKLWIGMEGFGLDCFDPESGVFTHFLPEDQYSPPGHCPFKLAADRVGGVWVGAEGVFSHLDPDTETFRPYLPNPEVPGSPENIITAIQHAKDGTVWVGSHVGLYGFDPITATFTHHYTEKDGLAANDIVSILEADNGILWIGTRSSGISRFDPQAETFQNYDARDGLHSNAHTYYAAAATRDGRLLFGGAEGFTIFDPAQMMDNSHLPPVVLTDFLLFNEPVSVGNESPLQKPIYLTDTLTLDHDQNVLTFQFSALNYSLPEKNQYAYKLVGFDEDWRLTTADRRFATYTNLNPGNYVLRVKASNNDGVWNEDGITLHLAILRPWWQAGQTYLNRSLQALGSAIGLDRWRVQELEQQRQALEAQQRELEAMVSERTRDLEVARNEALITAAALTESEQRLQTILDTIPISINVKDTEGRYVLVNSHFETLTGKTRVECLGKDSAEVFPGAEGVGFKEFNRRVLESREQLITEQTLTTAQGERTLLASYTPLQDSAGNLIGICGANTDITDRKQAEIELSNARERLRLALEAAEMGMWVYYVPENRFSAYEKLNALFGFPVGTKVTLELWLEKVHPADRDFAGKSFSESLRKGMPSEVEYRIIPEPGVQKWIYSKADVFKNQEGVVDYATGLVWDITERKQAEDELRLARAESDERAEHLNVLNALSKKLSLTLDLQDVLKEAYRFAAQLLNISTFYVTLYDPLQEVLIPALLVVDEVPETPEPIKAGGVSEYILNTKQPILLPDNVIDRVVDLGIMARPLVTGRVSQSWVGVPIMLGEQVIGTMAALNYDTPGAYQPQQRDLLSAIASQTAIAINNAQLYEAAQEAARAKSAFLANMSHELRTPLNAILGFTNLIRRKPATNREDAEKLDIVHRSGEHLLTLINEVLDISKIEAGKIELVESDFDLDRLLDDLEAMFALRAQKKGLELIFERQSETPIAIHADNLKLRQVLINLLGNAVKFTQQGLISCQVSINGTADTLHFSVSDTGAGISPEEIEIIFEAFSQTEAGRTAKQGTGLGLAISQQFVELMGGELRVESEVGRGSTFSFSIPFKPVATAVLEIQTPERRVTGLAPDQPVYRLLVVDDDEINRRLLVELLRPLGFELREAVNGVDAVQEFETWHPHLIWMDLQMPVMDGYTATKEIKSNPRGQEIPIIAVTASIYEEERSQILAAGCDDLVRKPFQEEQIFKMLAEYLNARFEYVEIESLVPFHSIRSLCHSNSGKICGQPSNIMILRESLPASPR